MKANVKEGSQIISTTEKLIGRLNRDNQKDAAKVVTQHFHSYTQYFESWNACAGDVEKIKESMKYRQQSLSEYNFLSGVLWGLEMGGYISNQEHTAINEKLLNMGDVK